MSRVMTCQELFDSRFVPGQQIGAELANVVADQGSLAILRSEYRATNSSTGIEARPAKYLGICL
jgi:hypothetical protein